MKNIRYILDERGEPVPCPNLMKWARWMEVASRILARTRLTNGLIVSTVFLGLDHSYGPHGPPILFETMLFSGSDEPGSLGKPLDFQRRYATRREALTEHGVVCLVFDEPTDENVTDLEEKGAPLLRRLLAHKVAET